MKNAVKAAAFLALTLLLVGVRFYHLNADPPPSLSWSSGIYSDEGIYAADARSVVLFGHWAPGDFHCAVIAPLHHLALLGMFRLMGVSLTSARLLGATTSLIALLLFFLTLRKQFDESTGVLGVVFLGLSPVVLFYNRLALLETPTVCLLTAALYISTFEGAGVITGLLLAAAVIYKPLAILCVPAFFVFPGSKARTLWLTLAGLATGLAIYLVAWQWQHRQYLYRVNHYYVAHQYLPRSLAGLAHNIVRSFWTGSSDGIWPYLVHHAPILLIVIAAAAFSKTGFDRRALPYLVWFVLPALAFSLLSYAPSRYFVLFWPGLAAAAAIAMRTLGPLWDRAAAGAFVVLNGLVIVGAFASQTYSLRNSGEALGEEENRSSTIVGQYAPELSLSNRLQALYVQPGLANSRVHLTDAIVLVTRSQYWDSYWRERNLFAIAAAPSFELTLPRHQVVDAYAVKTEGQ